VGPVEQKVCDGVWYYGTYCLGPLGETKYGDDKYNWPWLGPLVGFRISTDHGRSWTDTPHTPEKPLFGETGMYGYPVKIGAPHFVDFGKNMEHSPDGYAYLVGHGAEETDKKIRASAICRGSAGTKFRNPGLCTGPLCALDQKHPIRRRPPDHASYSRRDMNHQRPVYDLMIYPTHREEP